MTFTAAADLSTSLVAVAPVSSTAGLTLHVTAGDGAACFAQAAPFPVLLQPPTGRPTKATAELADVASVVGDVVTLANRGQYGTSAQPVAVGWVISAPLTAEMVQAIQAAITAETSRAEGVEATLTASMAAKAPLASPVLTGTPTLPTATPGTNSTQAASTAYADAAVAAEAVIARAAEAARVPTSALGVTVATLVGGKLPASQLTLDAVEFQGTWNASTNSPTLADGTGNPGDFYRIATAGTQNLGSGAVTYAVGDDVILDQASVWRKVAGGGLTQAVADTLYVHADGTNLPASVVSGSLIPAATVGQVPIRQSDGSWAPGTPTGVAGAAVVKTATTLGASGTLAMASAPQVWAFYTLTANAVLGFSGDLGGSSADIWVTQAASGGPFTFSVTDGTTTTALTDMATTPGDFSHYRVYFPLVGSLWAETISSGIAPIIPVAPVNTLAPVVSGTGSPGNALTTTNGTWVGTPTPTYTYQWMRAGSPISGATASTYIEQLADDGNALTCVVTATNAAGSASQPSGNSITPSASVPANTTAPTISGSVPVGSVLTCSPGSWTGSPAPVFGYQWTSNGANISGATGATYTTLSGDTGNVIGCKVVGTNASGSSTAVASSNTITPTSVTAPANTVAPAVTGTATDGQTLTCSQGTWTGSPTITYAYQWKRGSSAISGATASTYALVDADVGQSVKCTVTATNGAGPVSADSNTVTPAATVPGQVTGLSPTAGDTTVGLSWTAPTVTGGSAITDYKVEYQIDPAGGWTTFTHSASPATTQTVTGLTDGTLYDFRVSAVNAIGAGTPSATATATPVGAFSPASLSPVAWFKPESLALADGTAVASWPDSSGSSHPLVQASGSEQPLYKVAVQNGRDVVRFDGINDFLKATAFTLTQPMTIFIVCRFTSVWASGVQNFLDGNTNDSLDMQRSAASNVATYDGSSAGITQNLDTWHQICWLANVNGSDSTVRADGATSGAAFILAGTTAAGAPGGLTLGAHATGTSPSPIDVGELIVYPTALSDANRVSVENYLRTRWGTP